MKGKILGVLVALCMVCAFVGCADPVSEKPGENSDAIYKDSAFVGTWVGYDTHKEGDKVYAWKEIYILYDTGEGLWKREAIGEPYEELADNTVVWSPLSNTKIQLTETSTEGSQTPINRTGYLSGGGTQLYAGGQQYKKVNESNTEIYKDSAFVGAWIYKNDSTPKYIYMLTEEGIGQWEQIPEFEGEDLDGTRPLIWTPLSDGRVQLTESKEPTGIEITTGTLSENDTKLTVNHEYGGIRVYTKLP